jgi:TonB family protein
MVYTSIMSLSFIFHFSFVAYLNTRPIPEQITWDEIPDRFIKYIVQERPKPKETKIKGKGTGHRKGKLGKGKGKKKSLSPEERAKAAALRRARIREEMRTERKGMLGIIGAITDDESGDAIEDVLSGGSAVGGDLDELMGGITGVDVATSEMWARGGRGYAMGGRVARIADLRTGGGGRASIGGHIRARIEGRVTQEAPDVEGVCDRGAITRAIRFRKRSIQACYERELKRDHTLSGRIVVYFTITASGRPKDVTILENTTGNDALARCIRRVIARIRFPRCEGGEVSVSYPFVFAPAQ